MTFIRPLLIASICLTSALSAYAIEVDGPTSEDQAEYERTLNEANQILRQLHQSGSSCPSADLALSCGDGVCQSDKKENEITCPADCNPARVRSYNSQTFCKDVQEVFTPETYEEVQGIVRKAIATKNQVRVVATKHTSNDQLCTNGYIISTEKLNRVLRIEPFEGTETVLTEPGATIEGLTEWLHTKNRSIGYGLTGYKGITVAGSAATGAHGSSPKHSAILATAIKSIKLVTATGEIKEYSEKTTDTETFRALRTHLGMLGVVVQLRIEIRPQFNLDTRVTFGSEKEILEGKNAVDLVRNCDLGQMLWFPASRQIMKMCGQETSMPAEPKAENIFLDPWIPEFIVTPYKLAFHYGACNPEFNAVFERLRFSINKILPPLRKEIGHGLPVNPRRAIGPSHRMLSSRLGPGRETLIIRDWEVAIPESQLPAAMTALRKYMDENKIALPITGVFIRFTRVEEQTLLSAAVAGHGFEKGKTAVYIEFPSYYPIGFSPERREEYSSQYGKLYEMLIEKFEGRPHWGKNQRSIFTKQKQVGNFQEYVGRFRTVAEKMDPTGIFSNDFTREYIGPR